MVVKPSKEHSHIGEYQNIKHCCIKCFSVVWVEGSKPHKTTPDFQRLYWGHEIDHPKYVLDSMCEKCQGELARTDGTP